MIGSLLAELAAVCRERLAITRRYADLPKIGGYYASVEHETEWRASCRRYDAAVRALENYALSLEAANAAE